VTAADQYQEYARAAAPILDQIARFQSLCVPRITFNEDGHTTENGPIEAFEGITKYAAMLDEVHEAIFGASLRDQLPS